MELNLVSHKDPILKKETDKFDWNNPQVDLMDFATSLVLKMRQKRGLGLAAPQIGQSILFSIFFLKFPRAMTTPRVATFWSNHL